MSRGKQPRPLADRLRDLSVPEPNSGCILFLGHLDKDGYGTMTVGSRTDNSIRTKQAHIVAYEVFVGPVPAGKQLDHLCRVRSCINEAHIEPVTTRVNTLRGISNSALNALKTHCKRGHVLVGSNLHQQVIDNRRTERVCRECRRDTARERYRRTANISPDRYRRQS